MKSIRRTIVLKDYAKDQMKEISGDLDESLEGYADVMADSINQFNVSIVLDT